MKQPRMRIAAALLGTLLALPAAAPAQGKPEVALRAAMETETVKGDLKGAIEQYKKIAQGSDRAIAAKALIHMAECYQKLGDAESRNIYEQVVRDFADQKEAVGLARTRLDRSGAAARAKGDRPVWAGPDVDIFGRISPDGLYFTYVDWSTGTLMIHDMAAGTDHPLTKKKTWSESPEWGSFSTFSRDGKQLAYAWGLGPGHTELRVAAIKGTTLGESRRILPNVEYRNIRPFEWSPDDKWIAVSIERKDLSTQIGVVGVQDSSLRVLKSIGWRGAHNMSFSTDGRFLAYDLPASDTTSQRDVYVIALDGSSDSAVVTNPANDKVVGFSADGRQILFSSDRTGSTALWAQPFVNGKAQGAPINVKPDFGSPWIHGFTRSGALYITKEVMDRDLYVAPFDLTAGKLLGPPAGLQIFPTLGRPDWSADGKSLAYVDCGPFNSGPCSLSIWNLETKSTRVLKPALHYINVVYWSPDGSKLITAGSDLKGRRGLFLIDAATSQTSFAGVASRSPFVWSADGRKILYGNAGVLMERDLASGSEREIGKVPATFSRSFVSPDARFSAHVATDAADKSTALMLTPIDGGPSRELLRVRQPEVLLEPSLSWTLGGGALLVTRQLAAGTPKTQVPRELWLVAVDGSAPRKLDIDISTWDTLYGNLRLSADGRHIAFMAGKRAFEVWAMEGLLPGKSGKP